MRSTVGLALAFCLLIIGCSARHPSGGGEARAARAALTPLPTPQGVDTPLFGPALDAARGHAAFDGDQFLVVWEDNRRPYSDIVAARVGADGTLLDPENILLPASTPATAERFNPTVTYGAGAFLIAWEERTSSTTGTRTRGVRLGRDGRALGAVTSISNDVCGDCVGPHAAFDGTNYLVVWGAGGSSGHIDGARVSPAGVVLDSPAKQLVSGSDSSAAPALIYEGGHYLLGWIGGGTVDVARFGTDLSRLDATAIPVATGAGSSAPALISDGTQDWIRWSPAGSFAEMVRRIGRADAQPIGDPIMAAPDAQDDTTFPAALGFDGSNVLVAYDQGKIEHEDLFATWIDGAGNVIAPASRPLISFDKGQWMAALAGGGADPLLLSWVDTRHGGATIYGARVAAGGSLDGTGTLIARSLNSQSDSAVAGNSAGFLVAWTDSRNGGYDIFGTALNAQGAPVRATAAAIAPGRAIRQGQVALGSDGTGYLAAWNENDFSGSLSAAARLVGADGTPAGAAIELTGGADGGLSGGMSNLAVAFAGGVYLVVGDRSVNGFIEVDGIRVSQAGARLDAAPLVIAASGSRRPHVASDGQGFLVVWNAGNYGAGARVTPDGTVIDTAPLAVTPTGSGVSASPVVAFGAGEYLVVWDSGSPTTGIMAARVHGDGTLIDTTPFPIALQQIQTNPTSSDTPRKPAVSFDGARFVVVWDAQTINSSNVQSTSIRLAHVTAGGQVVGPLSVTTSDTSYGAGNTHAVGGGGGGRSIVSYPLYDRPAGYDLARVRVRLFADQASSAGGACVNNSDCAAGTCVDGVCCATACAGGALDCQACSIIAGAAMNGTCAPLPDGLACGSRGSCAAGICVEPPDAGAGDALSDGGGAGDAPRADGGADAAGDGGGPADGARADAGTGTDASTSDRAGGDGGGADAAVSTDAPSPDAGARADGRDAPGGDGSVNDAAAMPPRRLASSGCGCSTAAGSDRGGVPAAPIALAVAALIVLRRRRAPR